MLYSSILYVEKSQRFVHIFAVKRHIHTYPCSENSSIQTASQKVVLRSWVYKQYSGPIKNLMPLRKVQPKGPIVCQTITLCVSYHQPVALESRLLYMAMENVKSLNYWCSSTEYTTSLQEVAVTLTSSRLQVFLPNSPEMSRPKTFDVYPMS